MKMMAVMVVDGSDVVDGGDEVDGCDVLMDVIYVGNDRYGVNWVMKLTYETGVMV